MAHETNSLQASVIKNVEKFADATAKMTSAMFSVDCQKGPFEIVDGGSFSSPKFIVSILFTGTVYGEYILAMAPEVAAAILGLDLTGKSDEAQDAVYRDIADAFSELLNTAVGESIVGLNDAHQKLTITAPKVSFGRVKYPKIGMGKVTLTCNKGPIECLLYVDRMALDIAGSYKDALRSLLTAHRELRAAMEKLKDQQSLLVQSEKMAALGTMAAGVAHEINSPLATASLMGEQLKEMLLETPINKQSLLEMIDVVEDTLRRISKITSGMRAFAHGVRSNEFKPATMKDIVEETLLFCEGRLAEKGVKLECTPIPEDLGFECQAPQISQVLLSLIYNSCDAVASLKEKWIKLEVTSTADAVEVRVTDSGSGVPESIRTKIFDPFFTTKEVGKGMGLGLSIAKGIVDDHSGDLSLDSTREHTSFVARFPKIHRKAA